jgi:hypothetical protein
MDGSGFSFFLGKELDFFSFDAEAEEIFDYFCGWF